MKSQAAHNAEIQKRNKTIFDRYEAGETAEALAVEFKIGVARIGNIVHEQKYKRWRMERMGTAWMTAPPTEEGWYWVWDNEDGVIDLVEVLNSALISEPEYLVVFVAGRECEFEEIAQKFSHWRGPLTKPEPPIEVAND